MFSLTRKEQIVLCVLSGALVVGAAISYWDGRHPDAIQEFHVTPALNPPVGDSSRIEDVPFGDHKVDLNGATAQELEQLPGIGPKMAGALATSGIDTFAELAAAAEDEIRAAIKAAGLRFAPSVPTWAEQASYAAKGDWDGLAAFQSRLVAGRK